MNDFTDKLFRDFNRYTGDGFPNPPANAPLPIGSPKSGPHVPTKKELRAWADELRNIAVSGDDPAERIAADEALDQRIDQLTPTYALTKMAEPFFGFNNGTTDTAIFTGAERVSQGFAVADVGGVETYFYLSRVSGSTFSADERQRISWQANPSDGPAPVDGFTGELTIGHQQLSAVTIGGQVKLISQAVTDPAHTGSDAGRGFSVINWRGAATDQTDITSYQLFGYTGSGHRFENYHGATPAVSADGKWLAVVAQDRQGVEADELNDTQDNCNWLFIYDYAEVVAAADPLDVEPLFYSLIPLARRGERMQYTQAVAVGDRSVWILRGYSAPRGRFLLMNYDFSGNLLGEYEMDGPRAAYSIAELEGSGSLGVAVSFEPEGMALMPDGSLLILQMDEWKSGGSVVSFEGRNFACKSATSTASPRDELKWVRTSLAAGGAWVDGMPYTSGSYTRKAKTVFKVAERTGAAGELPIVSGKANPVSGATVYLGANGVDIEFDSQEYLKVCARSENTGLSYTVYEFTNGKNFLLYDYRPGADNTKAILIAANFQPGSEGLELRGNRTLAQSAGINLHGNGDGANAGRARIFTDGLERIGVDFDGRVQMPQGFVPGKVKGVPVTVLANATRRVTTGLLTEETLLTATLPGGCMGPNGFLRISTLAGATDNANSKTFRVKLGGTNVMSTISGVSGASGIRRVTQVQNRGSQSAQVNLATTSATDPGKTTAGISEYSVNTAADFTLEVSVILTNAADFVSLEAITVEAVYMP
jgi:hypothetical protein